MKGFAALIVILFAATTQAQPPLAKTLLWKVSGKDIKEPSYLYGTFHLMCPDDLVVTDAIRNSFKTTKQLYLELDMDDPQMMLQMAMGAMMKNDTTLNDLLTPQEYDSLKLKFKQLAPIPLDMLKSIKPFFAMAAIFPGLMDCNATEGWEKVFMDMAKANNEEIKGLETLQSQMDVVDAIPYKVQAQMLAKSVLNIDSTKKSLQELIKVYKQKDLQKMNELTLDDPDFGKYDDAMIKTRNANWIPVIKAEAAKMPTFFAFGAGHLAGTNGVINLLRKAGYSVTPVM